ncbi:hypothetical protein [Sphingobium scionense]|uniref:Uncharacterized protein n=1 Tax=Sphingobium scionense TaxID=1404341 RepID=A0A7W6PXL4_9SPHN|nr:hypothetical protein [Sphingobium scionense]MBB4150389.1 hypothetical protein [Sphingobium scionense]
MTGATPARKNAAIDAFFKFPVPYLERQFCLPADDQCDPAEPQGGAWVRPMEPAVNPVALRNVTIFTDVQHSSNTITVLKLNEILWNGGGASAHSPFIIGIFVQLNRWWRAELQRYRVVI